MTAASTIRPSYRKAGHAGWRGALRDASGRIVWECEHVHRNRDQGSSACQCAGAEWTRRFPDAARAANSARIEH